jgi:hypothetical protein
MAKRPKAPRKPAAGRKDKGTALVPEPSKKARKAALDASQAPLNAQRRK